MQKNIDHKKQEDWRRDNMAEKRSKEYMKDMLPAQRAAYFWYYYKWFLLIGAGLAALIIWGVAQTMRTPSDYLAEVVLVNADQIEAEKTNYFDDFITEFGYEEGEDYLFVDASFEMDPESQGGTSASGYQILAAMFVSGEIDVFLSDEAVFRMEAQNNGFYDLSEVLPGEILEKYGDKLFYCENPETGEQTPYGIVLDESRIYTDETIFEEVPIVGIASQSALLDVDTDLIAYLLGE